MKNYIQDQEQLRNFSSLLKNYMKYNKINMFNACEHLKLIISCTTNKMKVLIMH